MRIFIARTKGEWSREGEVASYEHEIGRIVDLLQEATVIGDTVSVEIVDDPAEYLAKETTGEIAVIFMSREDLAFAGNLAVRYAEARFVLITVGDIDLPSRLRPNFWILPKKLGEYPGLCQAVFGDRLVAAPPTGE
jgi:hypothetical protein